MIGKSKTELTMGASARDKEPDYSSQLIVTLEESLYFAKKIFLDKSKHIIVWILSLNLLFLWLKFIKSSGPSSFLIKLFELINCKLSIFLKKKSTVGPLIQQHLSQWEYFWDCSETVISGSFPSRNH